MGEVQKLDAKRGSNRNVMAQTSKELSHVKRAATKTEEQLQEKKDLLEQVRTVSRQVIDTAVGWRRLDAVNVIRVL